MACPPAVMDQESRFLAALGAATAFRAEGGKLLLIDQGGRVRVRLAALPRQSRTEMAGGLFGAAQARRSPASSSHAARRP